VAWFKSQTPNAEKIHFFWERDANNMEIWYARDNGEEVAHTPEWLTKKAIHSMLECPLCMECMPCGEDTFLIMHKPVEGKKDMHNHVYVSCSKTKDIRVHRDKEVLQILTKHMHTPMISTLDLPLWFSHNTNTTAKGQSEATGKLWEYNISMGALAFCPKTLPQAVRDLGVPRGKVELAVNEVLTCIANAAKEMWDMRRARLREIRHNFNKEKGIT
jgi:hypothetical protein